MSQSQPSQATPPTPTTPNRVSKVLTMLKSSLTPNSIQLRTRKRSISTSNQGNKIAVPPSNNKQQASSIISPMASPIKRQKLHTQHVFDSPPNTPTKPKQHIQQQQQKVDIQSPVKKLDFKQFITKPSLESSLVSPPVTPIKSDKEVIIQQNSLTTKKLDFVEALEENKENIVPKEVKLQVPQVKKSLYSEAKSIFTRGSIVSNNSFTLPEREPQSLALSNFIKSNLKTQTSNSLYISGPPGTGKTAQTSLTLSQWIDTNQQGKQVVKIDDEEIEVGYTMINCMIIQKVKSIFQDIYKNLTGKQCTSLQNSKNELLGYLTSGQGNKMNIIVLDELDKLITTDQQILFELFSWTIFSDSKFLLIGISNSLDMIDRLLPRLKINGLNPNTLSFLPYSSEQIKQIIIKKLKGLSPGIEDVPIIHPAAIQLVSKKSSNNTGDLRKAFDICRSAIEMVEKEYKNNALQSGELTWETAPKVKINHVAKICSSVFDNQQSQRLKNLNLQQKFIICNLIKYETSKNEIITINSFYEYYIQNIKIDRLIGLLKKGEFLEILTTLESLSMIKLNRSMKEYSQIRINSCLSKKDLMMIVQGVNILETLMEGII